VAVQADVPVDYYAVLGVSASAGLPEIKAAYRRRSLEAHPDAGGSHGRFLEINKAYAVLRSPERRKAYDAARAAGVDTARTQAWKDASADAGKQAASVTAKYEHDLSGFTGWVNDVAADFAAAEYGETSFLDEKLPTVHGSVSGAAFVYVGFAIGCLVAAAVGLSALGLLYLSGWRQWFYLAFLFVLPAFPAIGARTGKRLHGWIATHLRPDTPEFEVVACDCGQNLRVPQLKRMLSVTCPRCRKRFDVHGRQTAPASECRAPGTQPRRDAGGKRPAEPTPSVAGMALVRDGYIHAQHGSYKLAMAAWARVLEDGFVAEDAEQARFHAARAFARFVVLGIGCNPNPEGAAAMLTSVGYSSGKAWAVLGQLCQSSEMPPASELSHQGAVYCFQKATIAGDPEGTFGLAICYGEGLGVERDADKCIPLLSLAAEAGHVEAMMMLGALMTGSPSAATRAAAIPWLLKAAEAGNASAMGILARCYREGIGVARNSQAASEWQAAKDRGTREG
jgi:hypothetical protein